MPMRPATTAEGDAPGCGAGAPASKAGEGENFHLEKKRKEGENLHLEILADLERLLAPARC